MAEKDEYNEKNKYKKFDDEKGSQSSLDVANIPLSKKDFTLVFTSLVICLAMSSLDSSIVSTALPTISKEFNTDDYTWVLTAYFLGDMAFEPMFGKFADIFGRKQVLLFVLGLFICSSALCGTAQSIDSLIVFRGFQGIGGGGFFSMVIVIIADIVPLRKRGLYMGITSAVSTCASVTGPLVGGLFTDYLSWRWAFLINFPLCALAAVIIYIYLDMPIKKVSLKEKILKIDFIGTFLLVGAIVSLLLTLSWGGVDFPWISIEIGMLSLSFLICFSAFLIVEKFIAKDPIIPLQMFKNRNVIVTCIINFFFGMSAMTVTNTLPLLFRNGKDISATLSGLMLAPQSITSSLGNILTGYLIGKFGYIQRYMMAGTCVVILGNFLITKIGTGTSIAFILFAVILLGLKLGLNTHSCVLITQQSVQRRFISIGSTVMTFFHLIGGILGIALYGILVSNKFDSYYHDKYPNAPEDLTINNAPELEDGREIYVQAVQFSYRSIPLPASIITLFAIFLLKDIPVIGSRIRNKKAKRKSVIRSSMYRQSIINEKRKSQYRKSQYNENRMSELIEKTNVINDENAEDNDDKKNENVVNFVNIDDIGNHENNYDYHNTVSSRNRKSYRKSYRISYIYTQMNALDLGDDDDDDDDNDDEEEEGNNNYGIIEEDDDEEEVEVTLF